MQKPLCQLRWHLPQGGENSLPFNEILFYENLLPPWGECPKGEGVVIVHYELLGLVPDGEEEVK